MRLTALVESADHICCRYRLAAFRTFLEAAGHHLDLRPLPHNTWDWFRLRRELVDADAVVVQRKLLPRWQLYLLRRACRYLLFDFDDAIFLRDSYAPKGLYSRQRRRRFMAMAGAADVLVAGNEFLLEQALSWAGGRHGVVIPTCVDPRRYPQAEQRREREGVELVWIGSSSTLQGLARIEPLLEKMGRRFPGLRLKLVCDRSLSLRHLPVIHHVWSEADEGAALASADIGISWMPDDDWSRGKCGLKVLQYMAAGLPVVANPVGVHRTMIRHGETGLLAETEEQWLEGIGRLAGDVELRRRLGSAGRRLVESDFRTEAGAARWLRLLERLAQPARAAG